MSKKAKEDKIQNRERPVQEILSAQHVQGSLKISANALKKQKIAEIHNLIWMPEGVEQEERGVRLLRAIELYESLEAADGAEGMLALQMVGTHDAALECLRRAALPNQSFKGRDMALKHAQKLMTLYTQQLTTLNKHRGKGQQKVTVEYVNVEPGGQAIVGNVETGANASRSSVAEPKSVTHQSAEPVPDLEQRAKKKVRRSKSDP